MAIEPSSIHEGMEVIGGDGEPVGRVVRFDPEATPSSGSARRVAGQSRGTPGAGATPADAISDYLPTTPGMPGQGGRDAVRGYGPEGEAEGPPGPTGAIPEVLANERGGGYREPVVPPPAQADAGVILVEDQGVLGVGAGGLEIPLISVLEVTPAGRLLIDCTRDEAIARFGSGRSLDLDDEVSA